MPSPEQFYAKQINLMYQQICIASRLLADDGQEDFNQGQISARVKGGNTFHIKKAICGFDHCMPDDILECSVEKNRKIPPNSPPETPLHQAIYAARPDVNAIIHTHAPNCLVFGATDMEIKPISHEGAYFVNNTARFSDTSHTVLNLDIAEAVAKALADASAVFLVNHGVVVVGQTVRQCAIFSLMLERACKLQIMAESLSRPYSVTKVDELERKRKYIYSDVSIKTYWDYCVDRIRRRYSELEPWIQKN